MSTSEIESKESSYPLRSLTPLHLVGLLLAATTGTIHLWLGIEEPSVALFIAGVGFGIGIVTVAADIRRQTVVTLGKVPAEHLLERDVAVTSEAGDVSDVSIEGRARRVLVSVHPAATLYDPSQAETLESALRTAAEFSDGESGQKRLGDF